MGLFRVRLLSCRNAVAESVCREKAAYLQDPLNGMQHRLSDGNLPAGLSQIDAPISAVVGILCVVGQVPAQPLRLLLPLVPAISAFNYQNLSSDHWHRISRSSEN